MKRESVVKGIFGSLNCVLVSHLWLAGQAVQFTIWPVADDKAEHYVPWTLVRGALMKIAALAFLVGLSIAPGLHAQTPESHPSNALIGWPIYTSDGFKIGEVTNIGTYKGQRLMIGEVGFTLGLGTRHVLIPRNLAIVENDRIVLTITKDRVSKVLGVDK
jgi:hypothetical protein